MLGVKVIFVSERRCVLQEGLLDIELEFSDGNRTPLRDIADTDYHLVVESLDPEVVAFAPMVASHHPRVIAVGEGNGDLLQVTLLLAEECRTSARPKIKGVGPLATASASVTVDFSTSDLQHRPDILQNDGGSYGGSKRDFQDLQDMLKGNCVRPDSIVKINSCDRFRSWLFLCEYLMRNIDLVFTLSATSVVF
jgi:transmembrane protein 132